MKPASGKLQYVAPMHLHQQKDEKENIDCSPYDDPWRSKQRCTDASTPGDRVNLRIVISRHDDDAWQSTVDSTKATVLEAGATLHESERNCA